MTEGRPRGPGLRARGHLLLEAMLAGTVLLIALASLLGAMTSIRRGVGSAEVDQRAWQLLRERYEIQRAARLSDPDWAIGLRTGAYAFPDEPAPWTWTVAVSQVSDGAVARVGPLSYRLAVVSLSYRGRTIRLEALRW